MPSWWRTATLGAATLSAIAVFSYADSGFFSPDVQQQVVTYVLVAWLLTTSIVLLPWASDRRRSGIVRSMGGRMSPCRQWSCGRSPGLSDGDVSDGLVGATDERKRCGARDGREPADCERDSWR